MRNSDAVVSVEQDGDVRGYSPEKRVKEKMVEAGPVERKETEESKMRRTRYFQERKRFGEEKV